MSSPPTRLQLKWKPDSKVSWKSPPQNLRTSKAGHVKTYLSTFNSIYLSSKKFSIFLIPNVVRIKESLAECPFFVISPAKHVPPKCNYERIFQTEIVAMKFWNFFHPFFLSHTFLANHVIIFVHNTPLNNMCQLKITRPFFQKRYFIFEGTGRRKPANRRQKKKPSRFIRAKLIKIYFFYRVIHRSKIWATHKKNKHENTSFYMVNYLPNFSY